MTIYPYNHDRENNGPAWLGGTALSVALLVVLILALALVIA